MRYAYLAILSTLLCCINLPNSALADGAPDPATESDHGNGAPPSDDEAALLEEIARLRNEHLKEAKPDSTPPENRQMQYRQDTKAFQSQVESPEWQRAQPDRRNFAAFARHYINRIHCAGVIDDVLYPTQKGVELELKNSGHDLFLRVGDDVPTEYSHYPFDLNVICDGQVYQINGVIDDQYPATNLELIRTDGETSEPLPRYSASVRRAEALPHEARIARIMRRVWRDDLLPYWRSQQKNLVSGEGNGRIVLRRQIHTGINELVAWDVVLMDAKADMPALLAAVSQIVSGPIVALGRVPLRDRQRAVVLTTDATQPGRRP